MRSTIHKLLEKIDDDKVDRLKVMSEILLTAQIF